MSYWLLFLACLLLFFANGFANTSQTENAQAEAQCVIQEDAAIHDDLVEALKKDLLDFTNYIRTVQSFNDGIEYLKAKKEERFADWEKAAERGIPEGQTLLGLCHVYTPTGDAMNSTAAKWFRKAAEQGHSEAQWRLGLYHSMQSRGKFFGSPIAGSREHFLAAIDWFRKAADQEHLEAFYQLGRCYEEDRVDIDMPKDPAEAAKWFRKAAERGHAEAQFWLGSYLLEQVALSYYDRPLDQASLAQWRHDSVEGIEWHRKAAEQGHARAQLRIGSFYYKDDVEEAMKWLHKAAEQGEEDADRLLMEIFANPR